MKNVIINKGGTGHDGWDYCVRFPDARTMEEQRIRFEYEYPAGSFVPVGWKEARARGFETGHYFRDPLAVIDLEVCAGQTFPAITTRKHYRTLRAEHLAEIYRTQREGDGEGDGTGQTWTETRGD